MPKTYGKSHYEHNAVLFRAHCRRAMVLLGEPEQEPLKRFPAVCAADVALRRVAFRVFGQPGLSAVELTRVNWTGRAKPWTQGGRGEQTEALMVDTPRDPSWPHEIGHMLHFALWPTRSTHCREYRAEAVAEFSAIRSVQAGLTDLVLLTNQSRRKSRNSTMYHRAIVIARDVVRHYPVWHDSAVNVALARKIMFGVYG